MLECILGKLWEILWDLCSKDRDNNVPDSEFSGNLEIRIT